MFGKKKAFENAMVGLNVMQCKDVLQEFTCRQPDLTDQQVHLIAQCLASNYPALNKLDIEGAQEI